MAVTVNVKAPAGSTAVIVYVVVESELRFPLSHSRSTEFPTAKLPVITEAKLE